MQNSSTVLNSDSISLNAVLYCAKRFEQVDVYLDDDNNEINNKLCVNLALLEVTLLVGGDAVANVGLLKLLDSVDDCKQISLVVISIEVVFIAFLNNPIKDFEAIIIIIIIALFNSNFTFLDPWAFCKVSLPLIYKKSNLLSKKWLVAFLGHYIYFVQLWSFFHFVI